MHFPRPVPLFRSFKLAFFFVFGLTVFASFTNFTTRASAPGVEAAPAAVAVFDPNYIPADVPTSGDRQLDLIILHAGQQFGVDPRLLHAVIWQESRYKNNAKSGAGAQGLMQMIPSTAARFGCTNVYDPKANVTAGAKYLRWLLDRFDGDVALALAGYNAGEGAVAKYDGVPPYSETQGYVRNIIARYGQTYHPLLTPEQALAQFRLTNVPAAELARVN
ncbi:MAG TPA: lytic transglycosylase domain-containing protein [Pyrinomonadaceae bacterium]|jgi:soluble lytic murein transglycosylase-like protein